MHAILSQNLFYWNLRCFVAKPVLSRFTHFLCGEKFSQKCCPWRKNENMTFGHGFCFITVHWVQVFSCIPRRCWGQVLCFRASLHLSSHMQIYTHLLLWLRALMCISALYLCTSLCALYAHITWCARLRVNNDQVALLYWKRDGTQGWVAGRIGATTAWYTLA